MLAAAGAAVAAIVGSPGHGPSGPITPRWAVEAYFATALSGDGEANWELMCLEEQRDVGPREEYLRSIDELARADPDELFRHHIGAVHPSGPDEEDGFGVNVTFTAADSVGWSDEVLVVWERDGFRVCGVA